MSTPDIDLSLQYLYTELSRIDLRIRYEVLRWQMAGQDPEDKFRGLYVADPEALALLDRPFGTSWGQTITLTPEDLQAFAQAEQQLLHRAASLQKQAQRQGIVLRLDHLTQIFGLRPFEVDVLLVCIAPHLDLRYERLYGYLQDDVTRKRPTVNLALDLLCDPGPNRLLMYPYFAEDAPLFRHHLLEPISPAEATDHALLSQPLSPDKAVVSWLLGEYRPHPLLTEHTVLISVPPHDTILQDEIRTALNHAATIPQSVLIFYGADQAGAHIAAQYFAAQMNRILLVVNLDNLGGSNVTPTMALRLALRDARMTGAIPYLAGWDAVLVNGAPPPALFSDICNYPDFVIVAGKAQWQPKGIDRDAHLLWIESPIPDYPHRIALWQRYLEDKNVSAANLDITDLAGQFLLTTGQIRDSVATARDLAAQNNHPLGIQDLFLSARSHSNPSLSGLARKIVPRYKWDDIVLPEDQVEILREIVSTVRGRPIVMESWGVGRKLAASNGVTVLFAGPPGTGKTMGAEVIAADLGLDLYKIDLSTIVSKYIGETEKNLERIFNEAQSSNAILFFDEADAIFGKRSEVKDAHDRYANIEVSYLLQRMEAYDGVTMLATNLRSNVDDAFTRRLQFAVHFPFPEDAYRLRIWETLFPPDVPRAPDLDFKLLAERFKLAGGNIRNIIVGAAFLAAAQSMPVSMNHLLHATRREMQKMGRLVSERDMKVD
ncbi:MAG: AAA family ATPase [Anaerolineae bacterium]|nr:AAA family ATPase [Anaerolineae bacterium]